LRSRYWGQDYDSGYGWISIALHWLTAAAILFLLFAGDSISVSGAEARDTHTTLAICAWAILAARVVWRLQQGHPPRAESQGRIAFYAGVGVHYILLLAIVLMLMSGPLAGWSSGIGFQVFEIHLEGADPSLPQVHELARGLHFWGAVLLTVGTGVHVAGVLKHMFVDRDQTLDRIMAPPERRRVP